ncbi:Protein BCCIP like [Schistosoma japonicum]|nr:Protein BCCIP like [Schistosoma japonicum]
MGGEFDFTHVWYCFLYPLLFVLCYPSDSFSLDTPVFYFQQTSRNNMPRKAAKIDSVDSPIETLNFELEGFPPDINDRDSISILLKHLFPESFTINVGDLAEYIVSQNSIGTVIKPACDGDDDESDKDSDDDIVFAVTSVVDLSLKSAEKHSVINDLRKFILNGVESSKDIFTKDKVVEILVKDMNCNPYLLINERFENLPLSVCAESVSALPSEFKSSNLLPTHLLLLSWAYIEDNKNSDKKFEYAYPEMEYIVPHALHVVELDYKSVNSHSVRKNLGNEGEGSTNDFNTLLLVVIPMDKFHDILSSVTNQ